MRSVLKHQLSREIGHVDWTCVTDISNDSEPNCRVIITSVSNMDKEITTVNDSNVDGQAIITSITTPSGDRDKPRINWPERRMVLVARDMERYEVGSASLSETRFFEQGRLEEVGAGYTFF
ncbi:unnamed protein product [Schistocephalus solidus]|uniref:AAA_12 domain-containing protein n=1 Tax=Schistocephalus solidus TaxID=70667 RepID=A0A183T458_SCHSO|nr:unnamed protein product [Schistocephalus solidus]